MSSMPFAHVAGKLPDAVLAIALARIPTNQGHDDFVVSLALLVEAARLGPLRRASGRRVDGC